MIPVAKGVFCVSILMEPVGLVDDGDYGKQVLAMANWWALFQALPQPTHINKRDKSETRGQLDSDHHIRIIVPSSNPL